MKNLLSRLARLEQATGQQRRRLATVIFLDGARRKLPSLSDAIPILSSPEAHRIRSVEGGGPGDGLLLQLLTGLLEGAADNDGGADGSA